MRSALDILERFVGEDGKLDATAMTQRIAELEDELDDVRRQADDNEEQLGYLKDLQAQVNQLFVEMNIPGGERLTASDTIEYAVEHLRNEADQRARIAELEAELSRLKDALYIIIEVDNTGGYIMSVYDIRGWVEGTLYPKAND